MEKAFYTKTSKSCNFTAHIRPTLGENFVQYGGVFKGNHFHTEGTAGMMVTYDFVSVSASISLIFLTYF